MPSYKTPIGKRYNRRVLMLSLLYAGLLIGAEAVLRHLPAGSALRYPIAIAPALPILGIFQALGRYLIDEKDEYQRYRMVRQMLIGTGAMLGITTIWGFLESLAGVPHVPFFFAAIIWFGCFGLAGCANWAAER